MCGTEPALTKGEYEALAAFRRALRRFLRYAEEGAREAGITPRQHQLLLAIKGQPGRDWASIAELAEALQIRHHAAVGLVNRSERAGLVRRTPDPLDGRQLRIRLTERGEAVLERLSRRNRRELAALRRALDVALLESEAPAEPRPPAAERQENPASGENGTSPERATPSRASHRSALP